MNKNRPWDGGAGVGGKKLSWEKKKPGTGGVRCRREL